MYAITKCSVSTVNVLANKLPTYTVLNRKTLETEKVELKYKFLKPHNFFALTPFLKPVLYKITLKKYPE